MVAPKREKRKALKTVASAGKLQKDVMSMHGKRVALVAMCEEFALEKQDAVRAWLT